jgi:hypothetical protein
MPVRAQCGVMDNGADHPVVLKKLETADCRSGFGIARLNGARLHAEARSLGSDLGERQGARRQVEGTAGGDIGSLMIIYIVYGNKPGIHGQAPAFETAYFQ